MGMAWIRLDTNLPTHDKIIHLAGYGDRGLAAAFVYVASLAHSGSHDTSGFIGKGALPFVHGKVSHAKLLVEARLWEAVDGGWQIRNWGDRNLVGAAQQAIAKALSDAGKKGADARWHSDTKADGDAVATPMASDGQANGPVNGTYVRTDVQTDERPPRPGRSARVPDRARGNRTEARREIEELANRQAGPNAEPPREQLVEAGIEPPALEGLTS